jgi:hypothetical protein
MSKVSSLQKVAGLQIFNESLTRKEFTEKFNKAFDTNHDEMDFAVTFNEWELAGAISRLENCEGEPLFMSISDRFEVIMQSYIRIALRVEASHTKAFWASH